MLSSSGMVSHQCWLSQMSVSYIQSPCYLVPPWIKELAVLPSYDNIFSIILKNRHCSNNICYPLKFFCLLKGKCSNKLLFAVLFLKTICLHDQLKFVLMTKEWFWQKISLQCITVCIIRLIFWGQKISKEGLWS